MIITRDRERERRLLDALKHSFFLDDEHRRTRTGIHLSDLLKPRQAYWQHALPAPATDDEVLYFLAGRGHEEVFARLAGVVVGATEVNRVTLPGFVAGEQRTVAGISYRPDFRWDDFPTEFKTRRSNLAKEGEESTTYDNYLDQLWGYCALDNVTTGFLVVFSLLEGRNSDPLNPTHPELAVYRVQFSEGELERMRMELEQSRDWLVQARAQSDPAPLPLCKPFMCVKARKTVLQPAHCVQCNKDLAEPFASRHTATKTGAGHTVTPEQVEWTRVPRCKWYVFCRPQLVDPARGASS